MAVIFVTPYQQFFDDNGEPLAGGKVYTYSAGTVTPKATYTDSTEATPLANPVILDSAGRAEIWINGSYDFVVKDSSDNTIRSVENVTNFNVDSSSINALLPSQAGNAGKFLKTDGSNVSWDTPSGLTAASMSNKVLYGLTLSNNATDATNDIDIAAGACVSDDGTTVMTVSASITKRLDAAWAVGTGQGGLDTGSIANGTYHVWVIHRNDTSVTDVLLSASASSPTMPTNYTKKKCIGSIVRASAAILGFDQFGNEFYLDTPVLDHTTGASAGTSAITATLSSVPTGAKMKAFINVYVGDNGNYVYLSSLDNADVAASNSAAPLATFGASAGTVGTQAQVWTNTSAQIRARQTSNSANGFRFATLGWRDLRI